MSDHIPQIISWRGQDIEAMDRDQLLACIRQMSPIIQDHFSPANITARALGEVEMMKRGLQ